MVNAVCFYCWNKREKQKLLILVASNEGRCNWIYVDNEKCLIMIETCIESNNFICTRDVRNLADWQIAHILFCNMLITYS